jgi:hypothetical protein
MTKAQLVEAAYEITAGGVKDLTLERLRSLMTVTQFVTASSFLISAIIC